MPLNVNTTEALALLGLKTLECEQLRSQMEMMTEQYNKLNEEYQSIRGRLLVPDRELQQALREVQ